MSKLLIENLISGGIITNYYCTSRCRHCLYACSPKWEKNYIEKDIAKDILYKIKSMNCNRVHIGGGEPFLNIPKLISLSQLSCEIGVNVEYIETNASWFNPSVDKGQIKEVLMELKKEGIYCLLVSISPFHNEYIPFRRVKELIGMLENVGMGVFPWIKDFYYEIDSFDDTKTHSIDEYIDKYGSDYLLNIPQRYWIHWGGRAIYTYKDIYSKQSLEDILNGSRKCYELKNTTHFHIDLFGNYIPGLCSGLAIDYKDLGKELSEEKYPIINLLYNKGVKGLLDYAVNNFNFQPTQEYLLKCHLCLEIRKFLVIEKKVNLQELQPVEYYQNL